MLKRSGSGRAYVDPGVVAFGFTRLAEVESLADSFTSCRTKSAR
jgi:hypothetical protein